MQQKSVHKFIYKIDSGVLKRAKWNLTLPLRVAMRDSPEVIVSLNDSQCLRFIDEINGKGDISQEVRDLQKEIRRIKKEPKSRENKKLIGDCYDRMYDLQFEKDYICVIMNSFADYDRANKGFIINYGFVDGKECAVTYRRFLGTNGGIKNSTIVYVNEKIYPELKRRLDNGRDLNKELVPAKLEAYQALICSGSVPLPQPKGFIVVKDCITTFKEDVVLIDDSGDGEPVLTNQKDYEIEHNDSDGFGFMSPSYSRIVNEHLNGDSEHTLSGLNSRYAWTKGMLYTFDFVEFAERVAGSYEVVDVWGDKRDVREADVILTESMLKLWDSYQSWEDYYRNCNENNYQFSATKAAPDELENVRDTNYQFLQSYDFTDDEIKELCQDTITEIQDVIGLDYRKSIAFLAGFGLNEKNVFGEWIADYIKAIMVNPAMINDPFIRRKIFSMIKSRIEMGERGAIRVNANYAMISGDLYALAQNMFGISVTGLLRKGECYHRYWINKGADEIVCFRAPMTCHNNIRKLKLCNSEEAQYWYQYVTSALILNAFDTTCEAMNGADKDGDTSMCTDNPVLLRKTRNSPTLICIQKKAEKKIPTEQDIIEANKLAFNDDIGTVTNRITSMIEIQSGFPEGSAEYETLNYRIMCGQLFQQNAIDRAKGIVCKPMPTDWHSVSENKIKDGDSEDIIARKEFNLRIVASKKPYFMIYVYPKLKSEYAKYIKNCNSDAVRRFNKYNVRSVQDIEQIDPLPDEMSQYLEYYNKLMPVGTNACVINRIAWMFESIFKNYLSNYANTMNVAHTVPFDYRILKSNVGYSNASYRGIVDIYRQYNRRVENYLKKQKTEKIEDKFDKILQYQQFADYFQSECYKICSNEDELCDIVLDICYRTEKSKQFAWDICGNVILKNLLKKSGGMIQFPVVSDEASDFTYCGKSFKMMSKYVEVEP